MAIKIPCGGYLVDNETLKFKADGKTMYVATDGNGGMTETAGDERYIMRDDGDATGTLTTQSLVVTEEASVQDLSVGGTITMNETGIKNMADPIDPQDAATKAYVDSIDGIGIATTTSYGTVKSAAFVSPNDVNNDNMASVLQLLISALINSGVLTET